MKKLILILITILSCQYVTSQSDAKYFIKNTNINDANTNFGTAFYGGDIAFYASPKTKGAGDNLDFYFGFIDEYGDIIDSKTLGRKVNSNLDELDLVFSSDKKVVYFTRKSYNSNGSHLELFKAEVSKSGEWSKIKKLPFNNSNRSVGHPSLSKNNRTLYFSSDMEGTMGGLDIFKVLVLPNDRYGKPRNLGSTINSAGNEITPFVSNNKLYFSSDGRGGLGGYDIFVAEIDIIKDARNLGAPINSNKNDYGYVRSRKIDMGYFTSNRGEGKGKDDIYSFQNLAAEFLEIASSTDNASISTTTPVINTESDTNEKTTISKKKTNTKTKEARLLKAEKINKRRREKKRLAQEKVLAKEKEIAAQKAIEAKKLAKEKEIAAQKAIEAKKLAKEKEIAAQKAIEVKKLAKEKEIAAQKAIEVKKLAKEKEIAAQKAIEAKKLAKEKEIAAQKAIEVKKVEVVASEKKKEVETVHNRQRYITSYELCQFQFDNLNSVYFDYKKFYVNAEIANEVDKMIKIMKRCPHIVAIISSHTDSRSSFAFNLKLSQKRSDAIVTYILRNSNISKERIRSIGYGESKLRNKCSDGVWCSEAEHQVNRRTQFESQY